MKYINIVLVSILFFSCSNEKCLFNKACTEEFGSIVVVVSNTTNSIENLVDSSRTILKSTGMIVFKNSSFDDKYIPVLNDSHIAYSSRQGEIFIFEAYKNGQKIVSEEYLIGHDCCHIEKLSGKEKISL